MAQCRVDTTTVVSAERVLGVASLFYADEQLIKIIIIEIIIKIKRPCGKHRESYI